MITTLRRQVIKRCPFADEMDAGKMVITIPGEAPELHALAEQVDKITRASRVTGISHEKFTAAIYDLLPEGSIVMTRWQTGPWDVECSEGDEVA